MDQQNKKSTFYVTTPIYYVTAKPHLGSLYSTVMADVLARYHMLLGQATFFLTGTDEHGQKIAKAAESAGKEPKEFVDSFISAYKDAWKRYEIDYSYFIRTTDPAHVKVIQDWISHLIKKGDIYKSFYKGWYCIHCETFLAEHDVAEQKEPPCPTCSRPTQMLSEEAYFFKLSAYQDKLLKFYEQNPNFIIPKERAHEVVNFVKAGLKDLSISRTTITWGIPFPGDNKHVTYVWADALNNYITAIGYGQKGREKEFAKWWPVDIQVMGKDIIRFHAIYWPAFLMATGLDLPKHLLVHGWIKVGGQKMSKSLGNVVDPMALCQTYGPEPIRYYLMKQLAITHDGEFSIEDLEQKIASDLADDLGNLLNRMSALAEKNNALKITSPKDWSLSSIELQNLLKETIQEYTQQMNGCLFHIALNAVWKYIHAVNAYFHEHEPWKLAKADQQKFAEVLAATCNSLYAIAVLLWPIMPKKMESLAQSLGKDIKISDKSLIDVHQLINWSTTFMIEKINNLFEKPVIEKSPEADLTAAVPTEPTISIEDFAKVHLTVGTIIQAEAVEKSDKLLKLQVDFGSLGKRQILSGIAKYFKPEELLNKQAIFVTNLAPRKMMGMESQGMLLTASKEDGSVSLITPAMPVPNGTKLK